MTSTAEIATIRLSDPGAADPACSGGKGANLAIMARAGLPVPAGFVVTTSAYDEFVRRNHLTEVIDREIALLSANSSAVEAVSERLRKAFESAAMPHAVKAEIIAAHRDLRAPVVAVRSSATAEDLPQASFAGQQDTALSVHGTQKLCEAVQRCWSSLRTARALTYRAGNDIGHQGISVAVVVQEMVPADVAGVMFTADPVTGPTSRSG